MDIYDIRFITLWRLFTLFCCIIFSIWVAIDDNFIPFSDILWWQFFLFFMVIRGIIFQILYGLIAFIESAIMILYKLKICCGSNQKINIVELIFVIDLKNNNPRNCDMFECPKWIQYAFIMLVFFYVAVSIFLYGLNNDELFRFAAGSGILYYIIMLFERGKYNALYMLWTLRFHEEYFDSFVRLEESKILNSKSDNNTMLSMELLEQSEVKNKIQIHHKQNTQGTMLIKNDSDLPLIEAVQYDINELMLHKIKYTKFWNKIKYDYKRITTK